MYTYVITQDVHPDADPESAVYEIVGIYRGLENGLHVFEDVDGDFWHVNPRFLRGFVEQEFIDGDAE